MKPFFVLVAKIRIILLVGIEVKKKTKHPNKQKQTHLRLLVHFGKHRKQNSKKKRRGRLRKLPKGKAEDCQQAMEKEPHVHKEVFLPINIAVHFPFPSPFPFLLRPYLNCNIERKRNN